VKRATLGHAAQIAIPNPVILFFVMFIAAIDLLVASTVLIGY
jgi:hypothetical protein